MMMLEHIAKCAKAPKYTDDSKGAASKYVDEDFRPEQFYKESKGLIAGRLSDLIRGGEVCLFKGNGSRFSVSVENLSFACAVNKSVKGECQSSFMNAVRLLILQGWDTVIKGMFV